MINVIEKQFDRLAKKIKEKSRALLKELDAYFKRLLFPLYLFPIKLIIYTAYYLVKFLIKFIFTFIGLIFETIIFPFKSLKNFLGSIQICQLTITASRGLGQASITVRGRGELLKKILHKSARQQRVIDNIPIFLRI